MEDKKTASAHDTSRPDNPVQSAGRIFSLLELLAEKGSATLTELSTEMELTKPTVRRLLLSLISMGYAKQDESTLRYSLTFRIVEVANQMISHFDIIGIAHPYLESLAAKCGETVHLVMLTGYTASYIDKVESTSSVRLVSQVGREVPLYCSGVGKALLAAMPDGQIASLIERESERGALVQCTPHTLVTLPDLMEDIRKIRRRGYSIDNEEHEPGVRCIATVIPGTADKNAISLSAPINRIPLSRVPELAQELLVTRDAIGTKLQNPQAAG